MTDNAARETREEGARLMAAIAAGDRSALVELMARRGPSIRSVAARYLGDAREAEEVAQDVFVRVWRNAGRYDPRKAALNTWLYRIAVNLCLDRRRRRAFREFVGLDPETDDPPDPAPQAETALADRQRLAHVRAAIERLPDRQRMALLLSAVAGLSAPEIAESLGASRGSVEQLLVRARRALRADIDARETAPRSEPTRYREQNR